MSAACAAVAKLEARMDAARSLLCVGLDPELERIPAAFRNSPLPLFHFCRSIVQQTAEYVAAFKPNTAFFEAHGEAGWHQLAMLAEYLRTQFPEHFTICDAKRADIGNTNRGYVRAVFDELGFDSVTLHPYLGSEALAPFLDRADKASILLCRTSNAGSGEMQDLQVNGAPLWQRVAEQVSDRWNRNGNCMLVVGATYPQELRLVRQVAPQLTLLSPGIGAQGGDLRAALRAGLRADGKGLLLSASRSVLFAKDPAAEARSLREAMMAAAD